MFKYENLLLLLSLLLSFTSLSASIAARPLDKVIAATATPPTDFFLLRRDSLLSLGASHLVLHKMLSLHITIPHFKHFHALSLGIR